MNINPTNFSLLDLKKIIFSKNTAIILAIAGIAIIFLSDVFFSQDSSKKVVVNSETKSDAKFIEENEIKLKNLVEQIQDAGKCDVMITIEAGSEYIYAVEKKTQQNTVDEKGSNEKKETNEDTENKMIILNDNNGGEKPIIVKEILPKIKGIAVVCEGGDKLIVKNRIIETIKTLLDVPINSICVIKKT